MKLLKRPSDQAKLLFFGLLRTVSALATEPKISSTTTATSTSVHTQIPSFHHHHHNPTAALPPLPCPQLSLRLARRSDVPSISRCNLATLPENYNSGFYVNHLRQWPELAIVAVDESASSATTNSGFHFGKETPEPTVVAYVLGKVEERPVLMMDPTDDYHDENAYGQYNTGIPQNRYVTERLGHVTSLAVLEDYRRRGLAMQLMKQLHYHLVSVYGVNAVGLHVRQSNEAAANLYKNFGYIPAEIIPSYYQDGEDAYFMKKDLHALQEQYRAQRNNHHHHHQNGASGGGGGGFFLGAALRRRPWEEGPSDLLLPRSVGGKPAQTQLQSSTSSSSAPSSSSSSRVVDDDVSPELLTGTM